MFDLRSLVAGHAVALIVSLNTIPVDHCVCRRLVLDPVTSIVGCS